ncbi:MAG: hypothetical protein HY694_03665 [Deltaproteobacteria bacterium]|nr:hypothetical protein [Deltaproteobacteria bacterium]
MAGTYIVTVKSEGEALPESHRAHLVRGFKPLRGASSRTPGRLWQINRDSRVVEV